MPNIIHKPVLTAEVLEALRPRSGGRYVDGTVGTGGHAEALLRASSPSGWLFGCDRDGAAVEVARERLRPYADRLELVRGNFADLGQWVSLGSCHGVLLDLGLGTHQLEDGSRGFSFQLDGPLDMRMDREQSLTAADLVNGLDEEALAQLFWEFGEEPRGRLLARAIVRSRRRSRLETTGQLARLIEAAVPRRGQRIHPATRVFQALRMAVNREQESLQSGLAAASSALASGGRLAVITFHSLEDRLVKEFCRSHSRGYAVDGDADVPELRRPEPATLRWVWKKPIRPSPAEVVSNPRSRSAKLRVLEKL